MNCDRKDCGKELVEDGTPQYVGRNWLSKNKVYRHYYKCENGHTWSQKLEHEGTANEPDD